MNKISNMTPTFIFNKYQKCIHNANAAFSYYEKYHNCYSIRSVDNEMNNIIKKIGYTYADLIQIVTLNSYHKADNRDILDFIDLIDDFEVWVKDKRTFFQSVICYLENYKDEIIKVLDNKNLLAQMAEGVVALEKYLLCLGKLVNRMEVMLKSSQQIYYKHQLLREIA